MSDIKAAVRDITDSCDALEYPQDFLDKYVQLECLACSHGTETFLVKHRDDGKLYAAKCYDKQLHPSVPESNILKSLNHSGLPAYAEEFQNDEMVCVVREYIDGRPLDQYISESSVSRKDIIDICVQLCDILIYLHGQKEPIIHRDIKPQNIIVKQSGQISLIDFDISRVYHADAWADTKFFGTREFAPPEQYGFSQTDRRTDIYSAGILLGWMLTGETSVKDALNKMGNDWLARIYRKCTAFSPENRFSSALKLKKALLHAGGCNKKVIICLVSVILTSMLFLSAGFFIGRYTDFLSEALENSSAVVFEEPMIEKAVRLQLDKTEEDIITSEDLLQVTKLFIFGNSLIAEDEDELHKKAVILFENNRMEDGRIRSLEDLLIMPNLKQIVISMQEITDISPLSAMVNLEDVDLKNNPITDVSPLGDLMFLKRVSLFDTRITDLSPLANCPMLEELNAGMLPFHTPAAFKNLSRLQKLSLYDTGIDTLDGIEDLTQLRYIELKYVSDGNLLPLLSLPYLESVCLGEEMRDEAEAIAGKARFEISYIN